MAWVAAGSVSFIGGGPAVCPVVFGATGLVGCRSVAGTFLGSVFHPRTARPRPSSRSRGIRRRRSPRLGTTRDGIGLNSGALLMREWRGKLERVMVLDKGFAWNDRTFGSLSQVAKAITVRSINPRTS